MIPALSNQPLWPAFTGPSNVGLQAAKREGGFHESWQLRGGDPQKKKSFALDFAIMQSENGFKRTAEVTAIFFGESRVLVKSTTSLDTIRSPSLPLILPDCSFENDATHGLIQNKGHSIEWNLRWVNSTAEGFQRIPEWMRPFHPARTLLDSISPHLKLSGWIKINGREHKFDEQIGTQSHRFGRRKPTDWIWAHCASFSKENGEPTDLIFEGFTGKLPWVGPFTTPRITTLFFRYEGKSYTLSKPIHLFKTVSKPSLRGWSFTAESGELDFRGEIRAENRDFMAWSEEDTDGSFLHVAYAPLTELSLLVYRNGKLELAARSNGSAQLEIASRERNPYLSASTYP